MKDTKQYKEVRALIRGAGYSLSEFVDALHISRTTLRRYLVGTGSMPLKMRYEVAEMLHLDDEQVQRLLSPAWLAKPEPTEQAATPAEPLPLPIEKKTVPAVVPPKAVSKPPVGKEPPGGNNALDRRDFVNLGIATTGLLAAGDAEAWERLSKVVKRPARIDGDTLRHLEQIKDHCYSLTPQVVGYASADVQAYAVQQLDNVTAILAGNVPARYERQLHSIAAEFCVINAKMYSSVKNRSEAFVYYGVALECAQVASNTALQAFIPGRVALNYIHSGQPNIALQCMVQAKKHTRLARLSPTTKSWLAAIEAEARANLGDEKGALQVLEQAMLAWGGADPYWTTYNEQLALGYEGVCYIRLKRWEDAKQVLLQAVEKSMDFPTNKLSVLGNLADVHVLVGDLDGACEYLGQAFDIAQPSILPDHAGRVFQVYRKIEKFGDVESVRLLGERLRDSGVML